MQRCSDLKLFQSARVSTAGGGGKGATWVLGVLGRGEGRWSFEKTQTIPSRNGRCRDARWGSGGRDEPPLGGGKRALCAPFHTSGDISVVLSVSLCKQAGKASCQAQLTEHSRLFHARTGGLQRPRLRCLRCLRCPDPRFHRRQSGHRARCILRARLGWLVVRDAEREARPPPTRGRSGKQGESCAMTNHTSNTKFPADDNPATEICLALSGLPASRLGAASTAPGRCRRGEIPGRQRGEAMTELAHWCLLTRWLSMHLFIAWQNWAQSLSFPSASYAITLQTRADSLSREIVRSLSRFDGLELVSIAQRLYALLLEDRIRASVVASS